MQTVFRRLVILSLLAPAAAFTPGGALNLCAPRPVVRASVAAPRVAMSPTASIAAVPGAAALTAVTIFARRVATAVAVPRAAALITALSVSTVLMLRKRKQAAEAEEKAAAEADANSIFDFFGAAASAALDGTAAAASASFSAIGDIDLTAKADEDVVGRVAPTKVGLVRAA